MSGDGRKCRCSTRSEGDRQSTGVESVVHAVSNKPSGESDNIVTCVCICDKDAGGEKHRSCGKDSQCNNGTALHTCGGSCGRRNKGQCQCNCRSKCRNCCKDGKRCESCRCTCRRDRCGEPAEVKKRCSCDCKCSCEDCCRRPRDKETCVCKCTSTCDNCCKNGKCCEGCQCECSCPKCTKKSGSEAVASGIKKGTGVEVCRCTCIIACKKCGERNEISIRCEC